jgi:hypothetical protein
MEGAEKIAPKPFKVCTPGPIDYIRKFFLSKWFQSATQLAVGMLIVSLFVFVE